MFVKFNETLEYKFPNKITFRCYLYSFQVNVVITLSLPPKLILTFILIMSNQEQNKDPNECKATI